MQQFDSLAPPPLQRETDTDHSCSHSLLCWIKKTDSLLSNFTVFSDAIFTSQLPISEILGGFVLHCDIFFPKTAFRSWGGPHLQLDKQGAGMARGALHQLQLGFLGCGVKTLEGRLISLSLSLSSTSK